MGKFRTLAVGLACTGAASAAVYNLVPTQKTTPPDTHEIKDNIETIDARYRQADLTRGAVINILGVKCAASVYVGTINQPLANTPDSKFAALIVSSETKPCGTDKEEVETKIRALRDPFEAMAVAYTQKLDANAQLDAAEAFVPSNDNSNAEAYAVLTAGVVWALTIGVLVMREGLGMVTIYPSRV